MLRLSKVREPRLQVVREFGIYGLIQVKKSAMQLPYYKKQPVVLDTNDGWHVQYKLTK